MKIWTPSIPALERERNGYGPPLIETPSERAAPSRPASAPPTRWWTGPGFGLRPSEAHVVATLLFVACALLLFRLSLFEGWTFVGDSDRLNTDLNVRLFEVDAIHARGSVPTWSDDQ